MKGVDLFCGCGGLTRGFQDSGIRIVGAYDNCPEAVACHNRNFSHRAEVADISDVNAMVTRVSALGPDIIIGGPPCQDFSVAGHRREGARACLTWRYAQIAAAVRPRWVVMENVDQARKSRAYRAARKKLIDAGYGLTEETLNARSFGVPQNRRRFFCIGLLGASDHFLADDLRVRGGNGPDMTVRDHFKSVGVKIAVAHYYRHPRHYSRRAVFSVNEIAPTIRIGNRPIPRSYVWHDNDTRKAGNVRALTNEERALIQTFPPDFQWEGAKTAVDQMIGNAVPVKLAAAVAGVIFAYERTLKADKRRGRRG